ncbi:DUF1772 domain-containing protein [Nocardia sp. NBC_01503]|uniref:DUF1772 domain-containing protein n=1 Tax=Nocardia sp. NBC_01503 TaxID=2975997 RepID=UPI002E7C3422|nr:DUF1772 domain-containing protein [Nocardia sp. NBC_01503]WTL35179.1 DUF1772 domain-containing protein [Nocardia sp. NBC_01503]
MLTTTGQILAIAAVLANGAVYGTDLSVAVITRSVNKHLDDAAVTISSGWGHYYGDKRMPAFGAGGVITAVLTTVVAAIAGHVGAAVAAGVAVLALVTWLGFYVVVAKPINTAQTAAAQSGVIPANARALQDRWESILPYRVGLQAIALGALGTAIALF